MAWKKNDPNFTNDPRYLEGRVSNVEMQGQINASKINDLMPLLTSTPQINLMPDSGRFAGKTQNPLSLYSDDVFVSSGFFTPYNGASAFVSVGKFIHDNTTYGGTRGNLTQDVIDLLVAFDSITGRARNKRYGVEYYIAQTTAGSGTLAPYLGKYLLTLNVNRALSGASGLMTASFWLRLRSGGSVLVRNTRQIKVNGIKQSGDAIITVTDGWNHIENTSLAPGGYSVAFPELYANEGDVVQIALPAFFAGGVGVGIHTSPIPTINQYSD